MDASSKRDVRLVEDSGQKSGPAQASAEISLRSLSEEQYRTASERRAEGKTLRESCRARRMVAGKLPRTAAIELLLESNEGRLSDLVPIRHGRMVQSPFAFFRRSAALMAADLAPTTHSGLKVQACGDAHLMNFGARAQHGFRSQ